MSALDQGAGRDAFALGLCYNARTMDCQKEKNLERCTCTYDPCARKGLCCECLAAHLRQRELPGCCFGTDAERTYDRSFEHFARLVGQKKV